MPVIKISCRECGGDRFRASVSSPLAEQVERIYCETCSTPVKVDDVVWYQTDYISASRLPVEDNVAFVSLIHLIPGI